MNDLLHKLGLLVGFNHQMNVIKKEVLNTADSGLSGQVTVTFSVKKLTNDKLKLTGFVESKLPIIVNNIDIEA